jgi:isocitrate dehydrogenase (NAD+)
MLRHLNKDDVAERVRAGLRDVIVRQNIRTRDLGGEATTSGFADAVIAAIEKAGVPAVATESA